MMTMPKEGKVTLVHEAIRKHPGPFRLADIERACPGVGRDWIRAILKQMKAKGELVCSGKGPAARWQTISKRKGSTPK